MASNVTFVVRNQLRGVSDATKDLLAVTRRLIALSDSLKATAPDAAAELDAQIDLILKDTGEISRSVETAAALTTDTAA